MSCTEWVCSRTRVHTQGEHTVNATTPRFTLSFTCLPWLYDQTLTARHLSVLTVTWLQSPLDSDCVWDKKFNSMLSRHVPSPLSESRCFERYLAIICFNIRAFLLSPKTGFKICYGFNVVFEQYLSHITATYPITYPNRVRTRLNQYSRVFCKLLVASSLQHVRARNVARQVFGSNPRPAVCWSCWTLYRLT